MTESENTTSHSKATRFKTIATTIQSLAIAKVELAKLEGQLAVLQIRRLIINSILAGGLLIIGATLLVIALSFGLENWTGLHRVWWLTIFGGLFLAIAATMLVVTLKRFQNEFSPLRQSLEEIQEDMAWLREFLSAEDEN